MAFTIVLIALLAQRLFEIENKLARYDLFLKYYNWLKARFAENNAWSGFSGVLVVVLPAFIVFTVVLMLMYHLLGAVVYYIVSLIVLWYYMDARMIAKDLVGNVDVADVLALNYQRIFAIIFWFALLGAAGVVLYTLVVSLRIELEQQQQITENEHSMLKAVIELEGVLDWLPVRLLGLTYALVGQFSATFQVWLKALLTGIGRTREQVAAWAMVSLGLDPSEDRVLDDELLKSIDMLINRALVVWVVVLALFALGHWFG